MPVFRSLHRGAKGDIICSFLKYFLASVMDTLQGPSVDEASRFLFSGSRLIRDKERNQEVHNLSQGCSLATSDVTVTGAVREGLP